MFLGINSGIGRIGKADFALGTDFSTRMFLPNNQDNPNVDNEDFYPEYLSTRAEFVVLNSQSSSIGQKPDGTFITGWQPNNKNLARAKQIINAFPRRMLQDLIIVPGKDGTAVPVAGAYFAKLLDHSPGTLEPLSALVTDENGYIDTIKVNTLIVGDSITGGNSGGFSGGGGEETVWTNTTPTTETVGGVTAGSNLVGQNAIQILESMLYKYQSVGFTSFVIGGLSNLYEIGQTAGAGIFATSWQASNSGNINTNGISISYSGSLGSGNLVSGLNYNQSPYSLTLPSFTSNTINSTVTFTITADQQQGSDATRTSQIQWRSKIYYGKYFENLLQQSPITTSLLQYGGNQFINSNSNPLTRDMGVGLTQSGGPSRVYIFVHNNFTLSTISIGQQDQTSAFELLGTYSVQNAYNTSSYKIYRSYEDLNGAITLKVT